MRLMQLVVAILTLVLSIGGALAAEKDFPHPKQGKNQLDYCFSWQVGCGQEAADAYCVSKGFEGASAFKINKGIGAKAPTRTIGDNSVCDNASCDGFQVITCQKADLPAPIFFAPKVSGVRIDWCFGWSKDCGKPAADAFCQSKGFSEADQFGKESGVGPTRVLSTGQMCDDASCDGFKSISCVK